MFTRFAQKAFSEFGRVSNGQITKQTNMAAIRKFFSVRIIDMMCKINQNEYDKCIFVILNSITKLIYNTMHVK